MIHIITKPPYAYHTHLKHLTIKEVKHYNSIKKGIVKVLHADEWQLHQLPHQVCPCGQATYWQEEAQHANALTVIALTAGVC